MPSPSPATSNKLLLKLPRVDRERLVGQCQSVRLDFGEILNEPGAPFKHVYFPSTALVSVLMPVDGQQAVEVGMVGREGFLGVGLALGNRVSAYRTLVQGEGTALRLRSSKFLIEIEANEALRRQIYNYTDVFMSQIAQCAACNLFHPVEARLARWLLMTRDRVGKPEFEVTHQFLANMLGTRREGVTLAANRLQQGGLIEYGRGHLSILKNAGLEAAACSCYEKLRTR